MGYKKNPTTVCTQCRFLEISHNDPSHWDNYRCTHPDVELPEYTNVVTGQRCYGSLGGDDPQPNCRDINKDGNCNFYQQK